MKRKYWLIFALLLLTFNGFSQEQKTFPLIISVSNNATLMPGNGYLGVYTTPVHPGISAGTQIVLKDWNKWSLYESFRLGGSYFKYSQFSLQLFSELIFQWRLGAFGIEPQFQAGYMLAFTDLQVFELNGDNYEEKDFRGRSQFTTGAGLGFSYTLHPETENPVKFILGYLVNLQMPYIKNYAPVLIITSLQLGVVFNVPCKKK
jgi:hypothetical protein